MSRIITLITALAAAALAVCVPVALGDDWGADRYAQTALAGPPDVVDRAVAAQEQRRTFMLGGRELVQQTDPRMTLLDKRERAFGARYDAQVGTGVSPDAFERAVTAHGNGGVSDSVGFRGDDRFRIDHSQVPVPPKATSSATSSGGEVEWPQIGIGVGIGIALILGLLLALRATRHRPLAH